MTTETITPLLLTITSELNGGLSLANNHYHRLFLRRSEDNCKDKYVYHRKHNKAAFLDIKR